MSESAQVDLDMIADSARAFVADHAGPAAARQRMTQAPGTWDASRWRAMAELGWFGIAVAESAGGLELGAGAACVVAEEAGRALLMPPLTVAMVAAKLIAGCANVIVVQHRDALLEGRHHVALADHARSTPHAGTSAMSFDADAAQAILVARQAGDTFELRLVPFAGRGVNAVHDACVDGSYLTRLSIDNAAWTDAPRVLQGRAGQDAWKEAIDLLRLTDAAYLCGTMSAALAMSLEYLGLRRQFDVPIGSFQALQHRAADCHVQVASAKALVKEAASALGTPRARFAAAASIHRAKAAALHVAKENIQFHGAIGFADEHDAGMYLRRAMVVAARHSDSMQALRERGSIA